MVAEVDPAHEERLAVLAADAAPGLPVTVSSRLASRIGEYERMTTTVINACVAPLVSAYLTRLESRLRGLGFDGAFLVMRMGGGVLPARVAARHPVETLRSGPAGGVSAAQRLAADAGVANVITTDVGGTSFDVGLIIDGEPVSAARPAIRRLPLATRAVDIESIGTGGGSVAWIDEALGALKMGPKSAGADPGPAAYGLGHSYHSRPLTDAAVVLGWVRRLGGSLALDVDAARDAVEREIAKPLGIDIVTAAEGMVSVACEQMRDLIRRATFQRGHDPSEFTLVAYGGAGPQYAGRYAADLGVDRVLIPMLAGSLSAYGALTGGLHVARRARCPAPTGSRGARAGRPRCPRNWSSRSAAAGRGRAGYQRSGDTAQRRAALTAESTT